MVALKAFYLGRRIAESNSKEFAEQKIQNALQILETRKEPGDRMREAFYRLLMAEIFRGSSVCEEHRRCAKTLSEDYELELFDLYMKIVDSTQTRTRVDRLTGTVISTPEIKNERGYTLSPGWWEGGMATWDFAIAALGLDDHHFSQREKAFLHKTSLKEIMEKHRV